MHESAAARPAARSLVGVSARGAAGGTLGWPATCS